MCITIKKIEEARATYQIKQSQLLPNIAAVATFQGQKISGNLGQNVAQQQALIIGDQTVEFMQIGFDAFGNLIFGGNFDTAENHILEKGK